MKQGLQSKYKAVSFKFKKCHPCRTPFCHQCKIETPYFFEYFENYLKKYFGYYESFGIFITKITERRIHQKMFQFSLKGNILKITPLKARNKFHYWLIYEIE